MKNEIKTNIHNPAALEKLYRSNETEFKEGFNELYPEIKDYPAAVFWHQRLKDDESLSLTEENIKLPDESSEGKSFRLIFTICAIIICGTIFKIPQIFGLDMQNFFTGFFPSVLFPALAVFYLVKNNDSGSKYTVIFSASVIFALFMNLVPWSVPSDTRMLSFAHLSFVSWI